jgi:hypothetical protein
MALISINKNPSVSQLRQFACLFFPAFCAVAGYILYVRHGQIVAAWTLWGAAIAAEILGLLAPKLIRPFFVGSMYATFPIGWVMSHLLLLIAFYLVLTPIGWILRLFGHDPMRRKLDRAAKTYWIARKSGIDSKRYFKQY